jgi:hypothetical protein
MRPCLVDPLYVAPVAIQTDIKNLLFKAGFKNILSTSLLLPHVTDPYSLLFQ